MCRCWGLMLEQLAQGTPYQRQVVNDPCEESEHLCYNPDSGNIYSCDPQIGETVISLFGPCMRTL